MKVSNAFLRKSIKNLKSMLMEEFRQSSNINNLMHQLVSSIDKILIILFQQNNLDNKGEFCLVALGSYGRRELILNSDIDLLILYNEKTSKSYLHLAEEFIQDCWDIGLDISHQLTTVKACSKLANKDLSVISSILDMHIICGCNSLMEELRYQIHKLHMWPSSDYFFAKVAEQKTRYLKYDETAYNLEPNVKYGPGGLRDLQLLLNISKRHFGIKRFAEVIEYGFITDKEYEELNYCEHFLMKVRFALHMLSLKNEERLLFDYQIKIAELFNYQDDNKSLGIERFMKEYFKVIKKVRELNELLLQWFAETIIHANTHKLIPLGNNFLLSNNYIEVKNHNIFKKNPLALLEIFLYIAKFPQIIGIRANTIRLIRQSYYLMTKRFCASKSATSMFMDIIKTTKNPYEILQRMSQYGVLSHYLDCFAEVTGQMQYDLFHAYTVDQHTLFVIRNLARFLDVRYNKEFPLCAKLMPNIKRTEILYLAALFHDIAKGRGGDHSELGAVEAQIFAKRHRLNLKDKKLLVWLVHNHLLMSQTIARQDIYDPNTIANFCNLLPAIEYLDYLYLLTVADICATNPKLWNSWKASLLKELYLAANHLLHLDKSLINEESIINTRKEQALAILIKDAIPVKEINELWSNFKGKYFLHEPAEVIAKHTKEIINTKNFPLVLIMPHHTEGGTEVFIYMPHRDDRFMITTTILSNYRATIQEATILKNDNYFDLDTYIILTEKDQVFFDDKEVKIIQQALIKYLSNQSHPPTIKEQRTALRESHFNFAPKISFSEDEITNQTRLFLVTKDRSGLLATLSHIFLNEKITLHNAKITTAGERVEDVFYLTNENGKKLTQKEKDNLTLKLTCY